MQEKEQSMAYQYPPKFESNMTLAERIKVEGEGYTPVRHENTGVDEDEILYESYLLSPSEAIRKLGNTVSADVVKRGWTAIQLRDKMEREGR